MILVSCIPRKMVLFLAYPPRLNIHDTSFMHPRRNGAVISGVFTAFECCLSSIMVISIESEAGKDVVSVSLPRF